MARRYRAGAVVLAAAWFLAALLPAETRAPLSTDDKLANALLEAKSENEQRTLLREKGALVSPVVYQKVLAQADKIRWEGDYPRALGLYVLAQRLAEQINDSLGVAQALNGIGVVHHLQTDYPRALEFHRKSLALREKAGDKAAIAASLTNIGLINGWQGNYSSALEHHAKALALREEAGEKARVADSLLNIANVRYAQGDYDLALESYQRALRQFEKVDDKLRCAIALNNIAVIHQDRGNYAEALRWLQKAVVLRETAGHKDGLLSSFSNIGDVYSDQGNYELALKYYGKGLVLADELGNKKGAALLMERLGSVYRAEGKYRLALEQYGKSHALRQALGHRAEVAETLNEIGEVHRLREQWKEALAFYKKSLSLHTKLGRKGGIATALRNIALVEFAQGRYARALQTSARAAALAEKIGARETQWDALTTMGRAHQALDQPDDARRALEKAIAIIEELRGQVAGDEQEKQRSFEKRVQPYRALVALLAARRETEAALACAERAKARVLLDVLRSGRVDITKTLEPKEREHEQLLRSELNSLNTQVTLARQRQPSDETRLSQLESHLRKARLEYEDFIQVLSAARPALRSQRGETPPITPAEASALVRNAQTALLEFAVTEDATYLFVLTKDEGADQPTLKLYKLEGNDSKMAEQVGQFRAQLAGRDLGFQAHARLLHDRLLGEARAQLRGRTALVIVPDGPLWELPFQALRSPDHRYLIEDFEISYAPSLAVLREMAALRGKRNSRAAVPLDLFAVANPRLSDPLPATEAEVEGLRQIYGPGRSKVYLGEAAQEDKFKAEAAQFRVLHLATHGLLNNASPMYSQVVLASPAESPNEDGLLEAWEIMKLDLQADLVVLSACETGRGRISAGEGLIGLAWALFVAGSPASVVSHWKIDSESTSNFMVEFHRQWMENGSAKAVSPAEALRRAALRHLQSEKYWHPFYWASFVVLGDAL